jgi:hypothetical protein
MNKTLQVYELGHMKEHYELPPFSLGNICIGRHQVIIYNKFLVSEGKSLM